MGYTALRHTKKLTAAILVLGVTLLVGCKGEPPRLTIENARAVFSPAMKDEASVYLMIRNDGGKDILTSARTNLPGVTAEIHVMRGGLMVISNALPVAAKNGLELGPTSSHIMLTHLPADVKEGYPFTLTLAFERSGEMQAPLMFVKQEPQPMMHGHHH